MSSILPLDSLPQAIVAIGGLGATASGLVDVAKRIFPNGGLSHSGFIFIENTVHLFLPRKKTEDSNVLKNESSEERRKRKQRERLDRDTVASVFDVLHGNWINGMTLSDQKAVAKSLIKLNLTPTNAPEYATATQCDPVLLAEVAGVLLAMQAGAAITLTAAQSTVLGRFDLALSALLDGCYQRADQRYRNNAKAWAMLIAVILGLMGGLLVAPPVVPVTGHVVTLADELKAYFDSIQWLKGLLAGLMAGPLSPVAKDIGSKLQDAAGELRNIYGK